MRRRHRAWIRALSVLPTLCAFLSPSLSWANDSPVTGAKEASSITFECAGRTSDEKNLAAFSTGAEVKFEVSVTFGEGAIVALVDPEIKRRPEAPL